MPSEFNKTALITDASRPYATAWDGMTMAERTKLVRKDRSMRDPRWAPLVYRMALSKWEEMSPIQADAVQFLLTKYMGIR